MRDPRASRQAPPLGPARVLIGVLALLSIDPAAAAVRICQGPVSRRIRLSAELAAGVSSDSVSYDASHHPSTRGGQHEIAEPNRIGRNRAILAAVHGKHQQIRLRSIMTSGTFPTPPNKLSWSINGGLHHKSLSLKSKSLLMAATCLPQKNA